jgi:hypothetical protein
MYSLPVAEWNEIRWCDLCLSWVIREKLTVVHLVTKFSRICERPHFDPVIELLLCMSWRASGDPRSLLFNNCTRQRCHSVQNLLSSTLPSKSLNIKAYRSIILPSVLYGCETWLLTLREERSLRVFENRVLRRIFVVILIWMLELCYVCVAD